MIPMRSYQEYKRRSLLPLTGVALGAYYVLVLVPLGHRAESLDEPLQKAWRKLATAIDQTNATAIDFQTLTRQCRETQEALSTLRKACQEAHARLDLAPALRAKLKAPFQLVDYETERSKRMNELARQAREHLVAIDPIVYAGFPAHTADLPEPALLWAALSFTDELLESAVACQVAAIHTLEVPLALTNAPRAEVSGRWTEIPVQVEFTAPAGSASKLAQNLPLRTEELQAAALPGTAPDKMPLLLDRLVIKKQSPDKPDEVRVWLRAVGFVPP